MKKFSIFLSLLVLTCGIFVFSACDDKTSNGEGGVMEQSSVEDNAQNGNSSSTHTHSYSTKVTLPTCTARGYTTYTCSCGYSYKSSYKNVLGHEFTNYVSNNDATEENDGTKTATCDNGCGSRDTITDEGSMLSDFIYEEYLNGYTIKSYSGDDTEIVVPSTYKNKPIVAIGYDWLNRSETPQLGGFVYCDKVEKVILPDTIKIIGYGAFAYTGLKEIEIPSSVQKIVDYAFAYTKLEELILPNAVSSFGLYMFSATPLKRLTTKALNGQLRYLFDGRENNTVEEITINNSASIIDGFLSGFNKLKTIRLNTYDSFIGNIFGEPSSFIYNLGDTKNPYENNFKKESQDVKTGAWSYNVSIGYVYETVSVPVYTFNGNRWFYNSQGDKLFLNGAYEITEHSAYITAVSGKTVYYKEPYEIEGNFYYLPETLEEIQISSSCETDSSIIIGDATFLEISYYD